MTHRLRLYRDHAPRFAVAPMMDWTDRHCRFFHRQLTRHALLYSEMVTAEAILHGDHERLLGLDDAEHPVALQLGGSDPAKLAKAAKAGAAFGYDEINLNCGCPSDRVQNGAFGACLMLEPQLVADCVKAMKDAVDVPVTIKCRIGVDDQEPEAALFALAQAVAAAGADAIWVHARKAWLQGLSPKENREVPPLDYGLVHALKRAMPHVFIGINGGLQTLDQAVEHLTHVDGVMLGRAAYQDCGLLLDVDRRIYGDDTARRPVEEVLDAMAAYVDAHAAKGGKPAHVIRHMISLFNGAPGARRFRQILTVDALKPGVTGRLLWDAFSVIQAEAARRDALAAA
ncbi:MAG: tRNA dihydrouridine(20/20a) synthase DusA [Rhizobiaceae bacterium]|jgi:tRNA-dihydrouridine synthase A|nr:tRNA dihydrouridine(20/20a) synthase DusA [Rhizobiaceae bacterium]